MTRFRLYSYSRSHYLLFYILIKLGIRVFPSDPLGWKLVSSVQLPSKNFWILFMKFFSMYLLGVVWGLAWLLPQSDVSSQPVLEQPSQRFRLARQLAKQLKTYWSSKQPLRQGASPLQWRSPVRQLVWLLMPTVPALERWPCWQLSKGCRCIRLNLANYPKTMKAFWSTSLAPASLMACNCRCCRTTKNVPTIQLTTN